MGRLRVDCRSRVCTLKANGYSVADIQRRLEEEGVHTSLVTLYKWLARYKTTFSVSNRERIVLQCRLKDEHYRFIDESMAALRCARSQTYTVIA